MGPEDVDTLKQLGELRDKGLLTEDEFQREKSAIVGDDSAREASAPRRVRRWPERVVLGLALALAGSAIYLALDARDDARRSANEATRAVKTMKAFRPTLNINQVDSLTARVPDNGRAKLINAPCKAGEWAVGGGFYTDGPGSPPLWRGTYPVGTAWGVEASSDGGTRRATVVGVCVSGSGGLRVRSNG